MLRGCLSSYNQATINCLSHLRLSFISFLNFIIYCYVHWCFACMYVCVRVLDLLELQLQAVISCRVGAGN